MINAPRNGEISLHSVAGAKEMQSRSRVSHGAKFGKTDRMNEVQYAYLYIYLVERYRFQHVDLIALDVETEVIDRLDSQRGDVKHKRETLHVDVLARVSHIVCICGYGLRRVLRLV